MPQPPTCWQRVFGSYLLILREEPIPAEIPAHHRAKIGGWWRVECRDPAGEVLLSSSTFRFPLFVTGNDAEAKLHIDQLMEALNLEPPRSDWRRCP